MPITTVLKNQWLENGRNGTKGTLEIKGLGLFTRGTAKGVSSESASKIKLTGSIPANEIVVFTVLKKGEGLVAGRIYYVIESGANAFGLSQTKEGPKEEWTTEVEAGSEIAVVKEIEYGTGGRSTTAPGAPAKGSMIDETARSLKPKSSSQINYISAHDQTASGGNLLSIAEVTQETFSTEGGTYTITSSKHDLQAVA